MSRLSKTEQHEVYQRTEENFTTDVKLNKHIQDFFESCNSLHVTKYKHEGSWKIEKSKT